MSAGRRLAANALANWSGAAVAAITSMLLAPYLLDHLGAQRFGMYQVSRQLVAYFLLLDLGMLGAVTRFASEAIAARDDARLDAVSNSAMMLYAGIALVGLLVSYATGYLAPGFFRVEATYLADTRWLIWGFGAWWALGVLATPARGVAIGQQRFGWLNLVTSLGWLLPLATILVLFEWGHATLLSVGIAFATASAVQLLASLALARHLQPGLRWALRLVDRKVLRQLCRFGAWNLLLTVAGLFLWWTDSIVIARLLGPSAVPLYALPFMLITLGRIAIGGLSSPLAPLAALQVREGRDQLALTLVRNTRIAVILTLASTGLLVVVAEDLLRLWIGPDYAHGWLVYACLMGSFWAVYAQMPASNILLGAGDIRRPAAAVFAATGLALAAKIVALGWLGQGVVAVALVNLLCVLPVMALYVPRCACRLVRLPLWRLYGEAYLPPFLVFLPVAGLGWLWFEHRTPSNLLELVGAFGVLVAGYLGAAFWTLDAAERAALRRTVRQARHLVSGSRAANGGER